MTLHAPARKWASLFGFIGAAFIAGAIGSWATADSVRTWFPLLQKPAWNPPGWVFAPVWSTLYVLMGVAIWRARRFSEKRTHEAGNLLAAYFLQRVANGLWSVLFFGLKKPAWALVDIFILWALLAWMQAKFVRIDRGAALLWLPYLLWVTFAAALNLAIVRLN